MRNSNNRAEPAPGVLYVVGTPIGNLGDLSPRAESLLAKAYEIEFEKESEINRHSSCLRGVPASLFIRGGFGFLKHRKGG